MKMKFLISLSIIFILYVSIIQADNIVIEPCDDMYTDVEHPTLPSSTTELWVAEFQPAGHFERIMIKFDLDQFSGQTIESATLNLNRFMGCPQGGITSTNYYAITEDWDEETWDSHTHAQYDSYVWASYGFNVDGWHNIDITQLIQSWIDEDIANYGLLIQAQPGSKFSKFYSKEQSDSNLHPYLEINYIPVSTSEDLIQESVVNLKNYPNPFNPTTTISFEISKEHNGQTKLEIYNMKGQKVRTLVNESLEVGMHSVLWHGKDETGNSVASGLYSCIIKSGNSSTSKKIILMK